MTDDDKIELTTFRAPSGWWLNELKNKAPSAINGQVNVVRYKITIEPIDEPKEVAKRLKKLWRENTNSHLFGPIREEAERHGVELGSRR